VTDKTTEGYTVSTDEIERMMRNLCAYALSEPEPLQRYVGLTHQQVLFDGMVAALRRERGNALADLMAGGTPIATVVEKADLGTPQRVRTLVAAAGRAIPRKTRGVTPAPKPVEVAPSTEDSWDIQAAWDNLGRLLAGEPTVASGPTVESTPGPTVESPPGPTAEPAPEPTVDTVLVDRLREEAAIHEGEDRMPSVEERRALGLPETGLIPRTMLRRRDSSMR
jgi:hypothetical protein